MTISRSEILALLPMMAIGGGAIVLMAAIAWKRRHALAAAVAVLAIAAACASLFAAATVAPRQVTSLLLVDRFALFNAGLILFTAAATAVIAYPYFEKREGRAEEFYLLLLIATLGCMTLVESAQFVTFFLGLEILSVSLYGLIAYLNERRHALEAGIKYLILAAASSAFLLFGMALVYADLGTMEFARIGELLRTTTNPAWDLAAMVLMVTGIGFKLGLVPFHLWTPDVYQGAPAPVAGFIATASKTALVALLLHYFYTARAAQPMYTVFATIAIASMLGGNLLALYQQNVKRILAYSSIAHFGYVLVAFLASGAAAVEAVVFYLVAYTVTTLGAFGILAGISPTERDAGAMEDFGGLLWRRPAMAAAFAAMLLSLAGIPLTAGFFAKFYVIAAGAGAGRWALLFVLVAGSTIGLSYYLRIVVAMCATSPEVVESPGRMPIAGAAVVAILAIVLVWLGVYPLPLMEWVRRASLAGM